MKYIYTVCTCERALKLLKQEVCVSIYLIINKVVLNRYNANYSPTDHYSFEKSSLQTYTLQKQKGRNRNVKHDALHCNSKKEPRQKLVQCHTTEKAHAIQQYIKR